MRLFRQVRRAALENAFLRTADAWSCACVTFRKFGRFRRRQLSCFGVHTAPGIVPIAAHGAEPLQIKREVSLQLYAPSNLQKHRGALFNLSKYLYNSGRMKVD